MLDRVAVVLLFAGMGIMLFSTVILFAVCLATSTKLLRAWESNIKDWMQLDPVRRDALLTVQQIEE